MSPSIICARHRYSQALEVSEWMSTKKLCPFLSTDNALKLDLIGKVRGIDAAESYFEEIEEKSELIYGSLLNCYVSERLVEKSLSLFGAMKKLGIAKCVLTYNVVMTLYVNTGQLEKVPDLLEEMKRNGILPDEISYRLCMKAYGSKPDFEKMETIQKEMEYQPDIIMDSSAYTTMATFYMKAGLNDKALQYLKKAEYKVNRDPRSFRHLITMYTSLGETSEVLRLWTMLKNSPIRGLIEKAEKMLEGIVESGEIPIPNSWPIVAAGYMDKQDMKPAFECMKKALAIAPQHQGWLPKPDMVSSILKWLGDEGDVQEVKAFVQALKQVVAVDADMYHALIKVNVRHGNEVDAILQSMKADNIDEDEETKIILSSR